MSKDGKYLVIFGADWGRNGIKPWSRTYADMRVVKVFDRGKLIKEVKFKDLFGEPPLAPDKTQKYFQEYKSRKYPNGSPVLVSNNFQLTINRFITGFSVDWKGKAMKLTLDNGTKREFKF